MKRTTIGAMLMAIVFIACNPEPTTPTPPTNTTSCAGLAGYELVSATTDLNTNTHKQLIVKCPTGKNVVSAGWAALDSTDAIYDGVLNYSMPSYDGKGWMVNASLGNNPTVPNWKLKVTCICATVCATK